MASSTPTWPEWRNWRGLRRPRCGVSRTKYDATSRAVATTGYSALQPSASFERRTTDVTWDDPTGSRSYAYDTLIHLDAPEHVILRRSSSDDGGRLARDERDVAVLAGMQMTISVYYAAVLGVPLNVIDASGPSHGVTASVCFLLNLPAE